VTVTRHIPPQLLTDREVAGRLHVSARTVREYRYDGRLAEVNLGYRTKRVSSTELARFIRAHTRRYS
jgi:predicted site-specific integrase-resolvase